MAAIHRIPPTLKLTSRRDWAQIEKAMSMMYKQYVPMAHLNPFGVEVFFIREEAVQDLSEYCAVSMGIMLWFGRCFA